MTWTPSLGAESAEADGQGQAVDERAEAGQLGEATGGVEVEHLEGPCQAGRHHLVAVSTVASASASGRSPQRAGSAAASWRRSL